MPFALKTIESLLAEAPEHRGMLLSAASGFAQYSYGWVQMPADFREARKPGARRRRCGSARRNCTCEPATTVCAGIELRHSGFSKAMRGTTDEANAAIARLDREDLPFLYWTAAPWGAAISLFKNDPALSSSIPIVEALLRRGLELDETYEEGGFHELLMAFEAGSASVGGSMAEAEEHLRRAAELSRGGRASVFVNQAELLAVPRQDKAAFEAALAKALAVDLDAFPESRLANVLAQRRARWLLGRTADLFVD